MKKKKERKEEKISRNRLKLNEYSWSILLWSDTRNTLEKVTRFRIESRGRRIGFLFSFFLSFFLRGGDRGISSEAIDHRYQIQLSYCISRGPRVCLTRRGDYSAAFSMERMESGVINQRPVLKRIGLINALTSCTRAEPLRNRALRLYRPVSCCGKLNVIRNSPVNNTYRMWSRVYSLPPYFRNQTSSFKSRPRITPIRFPLLFFFFFYKF